MARINIFYDSFYFMITAAQIRAARAMLRWPVRILAAESGVSVPTIQRMELVSGIPSTLSRNLDAIRRTLEGAGIVFIDDDGNGVGVRLKPDRSDSLG